MENKQTPLIDIHTVIKSKNPKLYKKLPNFVINYVKKMIRQDELNEFIKLNNHLSGIEFLRNSFNHFNVKAEIDGNENFPEKSRIIIVANHPAGSFDGLHIINACYEKYGKVKALVNDLLLHVKNLNEFFMGVNKYGNTHKKYLAEINEIFKSDYPVVFFPAGLVSRRKNGIIRDPEWKKTFITQAKRHQRDIVPIHITGLLSNKFYVSANVRKFLGIKTNLESFLLPQELTKQRGSVYNITVGKVISYKKFDSKYSEQDWAEKIRQHIYKISENKNTIFE